MAGNARACTPVWAVIAGGGTGGHVYPGLAVARELVERGHDPATLHFVGARRGLEGRTRALEGFPSTLLPGRGWRRRLSLPDLLANASGLMGELAAVAIALRLFRSWQPAVVVSLGGYASLPCVLAAAAWRAPIVVDQRGRRPGCGEPPGRQAGCGVRRRQPGNRLPKAVVTGVPVRAAMANITRSPASRRQARERLGLPPDAVIVAVSGGSLGSRRVNQAVSELVQLWAERSDVAIYHVVGRRDWESVPAPLGLVVASFTARSHMRKTWLAFTPPPT